MAWRGQRQAREESELEGRKTEDKRGGGRNENGWNKEGRKRNKEDKKYQRKKMEYYV